MNWNHFLLWLGGTYFLYYLAIMLWDATRTKQQQSLTAAGNELTFSELVTPAHAADFSEIAHDRSRAAEAAPVKEDSGITASGGVPLRDIFALARKEAIVYTKQVNF